DAPRALRSQPAAGQGLPPPRPARPAGDLHLRGLGPALPDRVAAGPALAAAAGFPEARLPADAASGRDPELLPREGPLRKGRGDQREHPGYAAPGARLSGSRVPAPQGPAGHCDPPSPPGRMKPERITDCGADREISTWVAVKRRNRSSETSRQSL